MPTPFHDSGTQSSQSQVGCASPDARALETAYLAGAAIRSLVDRLEVRYGLTISAESRAALYEALRESVETIVTRCLEQLAAAERGGPR